MDSALCSVISRFGEEAKAKLSSPAAKGEPEDQIRAPLEGLIKSLAELCGFPQKTVVPIGETSLSDLKTRPDFAVTVRNALVGFIEIKAPGKGADPRRFRDAHDKDQWQKLESLPNLVYTDGNEFSLWRSGQLVGSVVHLSPDIEETGSKLTAPASLLLLFEDFLQWEPIPPRNPKQLAEMTARLCRLLRDEVTEQLSLGSSALTQLKVDWRKLLFPEATDAQFADGYAQAVTFGLLMARAREIELSEGLSEVSRELGRTNSLIGAALRVLTDDAENQETLKTSLGTLTRVLDAVHWSAIGKGDPDAWLYFYEDFLEVYDNTLRKLTGSYYTPPEVVGAMVRLVDDVLRTRFSLPTGLASPDVTLADPAVGTGTFILGVLRKIGETISADEGPGAVPGVIDSAIKRLIAFEVQLGPFAVAQLRILAELGNLMGKTPRRALRMYVTDTLGNPYVEEEWFPAMLAPIGEQRRQANKIKRTEPITVVIGNPPYKEKARDLGGWIESGGERPAPLGDWMPPRNWGVGAHAKHLRNLYVYFWRWATWKVFDCDPNPQGIVCFITVAGFLNGPGFQKMRDYLRRKADEIWVIDCSPEGHRPTVNTRIFQGVMQPVSIVLASRSPKNDEGVPATVRFRSLRPGLRTAKSDELGSTRIDTRDWQKCPSDWRAPFLPESKGAWATFPALEDLFDYNGSGVMPGRTWVIAPDPESLERRWEALQNSRDTEKEALFHPHLKDKTAMGDRHSKRVLREGLPGFEYRHLSVADDNGPCVEPIRYGYRSFDRHWIIPDKRLVNRPNPKLWDLNSNRQVHLTALTRTSPFSGPAVTFTGLIPDLDHYNGRGGRAFPLYGDNQGILSNVRPTLLKDLSRRFEKPITPEDLVAYIAAIVAHPGFTERFKSNLKQPGLRVPVTVDWMVFRAATELGRLVIWLQTFGERFTDPENGRPAQPPRLPAGRAPRIPAAGAIPQDPSKMPETINYDPAKRRLLVGEGYVENVPPAVWNYEVSGKQVIRQWFSYRKADRKRPIIGDRRPPSRLGEIQPDYWLSEYTTELINLLNVIGRLVELESEQADLLEKVCAGDTISADELREAGAFQDAKSEKQKGQKHDLPEQLNWIDGVDRAEGDSKRVWV